MNEAAVLKEIGLSDGETKVYLALLKLGETTVSALTKRTGQHRTTIYDFLEHLQEKGLVSFNIQRGVRRYKAAEPTRLLAMLKEKEQGIREALPSLQALHDENKANIEVEVFRGVEGFKSIVNDRILSGTHMYAFGVDERKYKKAFGHVMEHLFREEQRLGIKEFLLTSEDVKFQYRFKNLEYRSVPAEYFDPNATIVYGDSVVHTIWEPLSFILIRNKGLAESYKRHFKLLWKMAKKR